MHIMWRELLLKKQLRVQADSWGDMGGGMGLVNIAAGLSGNEALSGITNVAAAVWLRGRARAASARKSYGEAMMYYMASASHASQAMQLFASSRKNHDVRNSVSFF